MSHKCRNAVAVMIAIGVSACGGHHSRTVSPADPFAQIAVIPLSVGELAGTNVLLLPAGALVAGDSAHPLADLEPRRPALLAFANAALDAALRRDGREVSWLGLEEQRRAARRNPTLGIE